MGILRRVGQIGVDYCRTIPFNDGGARRLRRTGKDLFCVRVCFMETQYLPYGRVRCWDVFDQRWTEGYPTAQVLQGHTLDRDRIVGHVVSGVVGEIRRLQSQHGGGVDLVEALEWFRVPPVYWRDVVVALNGSPSLGEGKCHVCTCGELLQEAGDVCFRCEDLY